MYAVIKTGGRQYKIAAGEKLKVKRIPMDVGAEITLDQALAAGAGSQLKVGAPLMNGAAIKTAVISHGRHDKVHIFKMHRRKRHQKRQRHRQNYAKLRIDSIVA